MANRYEPKSRGASGPTRPLFITLLLVCLGGNALLFSLAAILDLFGALLGFDLIQHHAADGQPISRRQFYAEYSLQFFTVVLWAGSLAYLLWRRHRLARHVLLATFLLAATISLPALLPQRLPDLAVFLAEFAAVTALMIWYLYRKRSVTAYFGSPRDS